MQPHERMQAAFYDRKQAACIASVAPSSRGRLIQAACPGTL